jgi:hypothetical protein
LGVAEDVVDGAADSCFGIYCVVGERKKRKRGEKKIIQREPARGMEGVKRLGAAFALEILHLRVEQSHWHRLFYYTQSC